MKTTQFIVIYITIVLCGFVVGKQDNQDGGQEYIVGDLLSLNDNTILTMGRNYKNPLLRLIGTAMKNNKRDILDQVSSDKSDMLGKICSLYKCDEWSTWSTCTAVVQGTFGMTTRNRQCGRSLSFCPHDASKTLSTELDSRVCMGEECPPGFDKTKNDFCFMFHGAKMNRTDAENYCVEKGSFVVNINSKIKSDDLHAFLSKIGKQTSEIWMNWRRKDIISPWEYTYEAGPGNFSNWGGKNPDNGPEDLCMLEYNDRQWYDTYCTNKWTVVCEFV